jgi:hypothetical protein
MSYPASLNNIPTVSTGQLITSAYVNCQTNAINNIEAALGLNPARAVCEGRLTLATGTPVPASDQAGKTTIYFTAFQGNRMALYDGVNTWNILSYASDISLALGTLVANTNYDVFAYNNAGAIALELGPAWTTSLASSGAARATALSLQDGVLVKSTDSTRRYLGTFTTTSTTTTEDSAANRFLFNVNNQVVRHMSVQNSSSVTTTASSFSALSGTTANFLVGFPTGALSAAAIANAGQHSASGATSSLGVSVNGAAPGAAAYATMDAPSAGTNFSLIAPMSMSYPVLGANAIAAAAQTSASTLTVVKPGVVGSMEM